MPSKPKTVCLSTHWRLVSPLATEIRNVAGPAAKDPAREEPQNRASERHDEVRTETDEQKKARRFTNYTVNEASVSEPAHRKQYRSARPLHQRDDAAHGAQAVNAQLH